ncbi:MAG: PIN domain-containing protein [Austwickia sp.]|nr:PIN domain-containing protein [Austwickia sp.]
MTGVVVDASVLVDALVGADAAELHGVLGDRPLLAPAHVDAEVLSALRGLLLGGHLSRKRCRDALLDLDALPIDRWPLTSVPLAGAFDLADTMSSYDALYVCLAQATQLPLVTRDRRLARAAHGRISVELV